MDLSKYAALFLAESREHLSACDRLLLEWEREPASARQVGGLFRALHTVKGMAATMGYAGVAVVAHRLENLLDALRRRAAAPSAHEFQLLRRSLDALTAGVEGAVAGASGLPASGLLDELDAAASVVGEAVMTTEHPAVSPRPSGVFAAAREEARPVQVALRRDAVMRGARAALVLQRAEGLGAVSAVRPAPTHFDSQDFDGRFAFRLATTATEQEIETSLRTASGTSSRSGSLRRGRMTSFNPARWAARSFCLTPPIGSTLPRRVTSPVMPTCSRTGRPDSRLASAVTIVMPADGPSFGTAPAGTCTWNCWPSKAAASIPRSAACERTYDRAICADSFITSPS